MSKPITFKDKPLAYSGSSIFYGDPALRFIVKITALESKDFMDEKIPTLLSVELLDILDVKKPQLTMKGERTSLYDALDIAHIWLERSMLQTEE